MMKWFLFLALATSTAQADIYKCPKGSKIVYQDTPCPNARSIDNTNGIKPSLDNQLNAKYRAARDRETVTRQDGSKYKATANKREHPSAIDPQTGEFLPGVEGGVINPRTGEFYPDIGEGYVNPRTGGFAPKQ